MKAIIISIVLIIGLSATAIYYPVQVDATLTGDGTYESPLGVASSFSSTKVSVSDTAGMLTNYVERSGSQTMYGTLTFNVDPIIPDEAYGSGWDGVLEPPTKNAVYDKINAMGVPTITYLSSNATANATTTGVEITGVNTTLTAGSYVFTYHIVYQSGATTTGIRFGVNYTGTASMFVANMRLQESTTAASTGAASQAATGTQLKLVSGSSCRAESTTAPNLNLSISVDAANSNMYAIIEGTMIVSDGGDIELWHASEVAASSQVMAGTSLIITKVN